MPVALNMNDFNLDLYPSYAKMSFIDEIFEKYLESEKCPRLYESQKDYNFIFSLFSGKINE